MREAIFFQKRALTVWYKVFIFCRQNEEIVSAKSCFHKEKYIVGCRGASQLGGSLIGILLGYKANKLKESLSYPLGIIRTLV